LRGSLSDDQRRETLKQFAKDDSVRVLLVSVKVGGVGLNLTSASVVVMMEPWWNPAIEDQAIQRVNRMGQTREMKVFKLVTEDSIEERICQIREQKRELFKLAIEDVKRADKDDIDPTQADNLNASRLQFLLRQGRGNGYA
jgi:DNA repair protein RAD5